MWFWRKFLTSVKRMNCIAWNERETNRKKIKKAKWSINNIRRRSVSANYFDFDFDSMQNQEKRLKGERKKTYEMSCKSDSCQTTMWSMSSTSTYHHILSKCKHCHCCLRSSAAPSSIERSESEFSLSSSLPKRQTMCRWENEHHAIE